MIRQPLLISALLPGRRATIAAPADRSYVRDWQSASGHSGPSPANKLPEFVGEPPRTASPDEQAHPQEAPAEPGHQASPSGMSNSPAAIAAIA